jgi:hypothetical protein
MILSMFQIKYHLFQSKKPTEVNRPKSSLSDRQNLIKIKATHVGGL